jgi:3-methyladenine DNA glycosylase/8-oxoguanine DNA glycosylase
VVVLEVVVGAVVVDVVVVVVVEVEVPVPHAPAPASAVAERVRPFATTAFLYVWSAGKHVVVT